MSGGWTCTRNCTKKKTKKKKETASDKPKAGGLANAVIATSDSEDDCTFSVEEVSNNNSLSSLETVLNSDESVGNCNESAVTTDADWFSEVEEEPVTDAKFDEDWSHVSAGLDNLSSRDSMTSEWNSLPGVLRVTNQESSNPIHTELFDLGCISHMSPYSGEFSSFTPIPSSPSMLPTISPLMLLQRESLSLTYLTVSRPLSFA